MAEKTTVILEALMNVTDVESKIGRIQKGLKTLNIPKDVAANLTDGLNKLGPLLKDYKKQLNNGFNTQKDVNNFNTLGKKIDEVFSDIDSEIKKVNSKEIKLNVDLTDIKNTRAELAKQGKELENTINSTFNKIGDGLKKKNPNFDLSFLKQGPVAASLKPIGKELAEAFNTRDIERYRAAYEKLLKTISGMSASSKTKQNLAKQMGLDEKFINDADKVNAKITELLRILRIPDTSFGAFEEGKAKLESTDQALNKLLQDAQSRGEGAFSGIANEINNTQKAMHGLTSETSSYGDSMATAAGQVRDLQQSTQYFFSLRNMLNLLKRGIDDAVQSVKELDAAMTETAVVTDYKVSDLWGMLPQYTQLANQLGATTQGAYETMTLYFQQGLDQQQAFEIGAETMKMARIAGLDYAETTDMMTAALRGFNMELNETSAKRINDVYSELAAITASDTEELGTAMQRTASIAHSAGMSFEGTTAFLAQAIETTREPAENIGTAMKTIVARFQEMKENPLEISEVDGEEVNYNKVDAALKSIGVSLKDTNGQFRELDQVFLDISSRWDSLSQTQQRYIATVAAGSRQQSRFIAMMDNYDRTVQLFEAANNSAGASDEQFGKTMDSLESKLNKLHNAWQAFTMGIANNGMIKLAVDGLTGFLTVTNKIIDTLSLGSGAIKSFLSVFAAFTGLKVAGRAANSLIGGLGGLVDPQSTIKEGLKIGLFGQGKTNAQAQAITTPIVGVLNKISSQIAQIKNNGVNNKGQSSSEVKNTSKQEYLDIKKQFDKLSGSKGFKMSEASSLFGQLDTKHQLSMFNNNPGTRTAMKKASMAWFDSKGFSEEFTSEGKQYISAIYKGMKDGQIPVDKGIRLIGRPDLWGEYFATDAAKSFSNKYAQSLTVNEADLRNAADQMAERFSNEQLSAMTAEEYSRYADDLALKNAAERSSGHGEAKGKVSDMGRFANDIGSVADKFTQAGYGITTFGNALSQLGGPLGTIGTAISAFGGAVSTIGASISGATGIISLFTEGLVTAEGTVLVAGSTIAAVAAPLAAAAAAFLLVRAHIKKVKEAGEEVTKTFNDTNKEVEDNISKLKSYQTEFATLSQGVDNNGNNVSLDDSQYQRYLEIVDDIAKINPEIVQGYNAQGHAIIDNNKALDETLKKQQQIKKEALDTYTKTGSLQKLINARNVDSNYTGTKSRSKRGGVGYGQYGVGSQARLATTTGGMASDVFQIADELRLIRTKDDLGKTLKVDNNMLQKYGIESMDALISGEEQAVKNFIKHRDKIQAELTNSGFELSNSLIKGFDKLNEDQKAFDEAIQPVYDNLLASVSKSPFYEELGSEFRSAISLGLKDIASQDLSASEMQSQANSLVQEFDNLTRAGGEYATAMEQVEAAQDKFASSLDASQYAEDTAGALTKLNSLLKEYEGNTTAYGQAVTEYLTNQIEKIKNFTEEGSVSLTEALNGMTNTISAAEGAYDSFQESTKTDFSTGAQSMKSIFEEITKETDGVMLHMEKFGDATMWKGARALLGDEFVEKNGENVELVKKELLSLKSELQDGEKGFAAFWDNFKKVDDSKIEGFTWNKDGSYDIDRDINPDVYKEIAENMHRSEEYLVSMLNKGRQFADIDFTNIDDVRKALSTDNAAIAGTSTTEGKKDLYVKQDYLQNAMSEAGIVNPSEQAKETEKLLAKGIKIIPNANDMTKKDFKNMGISDIPSLVQKLGDTGQFNRSEIEEYAQQMEGYDAGEFNTLYKDYLDSQEHPELPSINSIDNNVASIANMIAHEQGIATQEDRDSYHDANKLTYGEAGVMDSLPQLFSLGKNAEGKALNADEFKTIQKHLSKQAETYANTADYYEKQAKKATEEGRTKDAAWFKEAAADYDKMSGDIDTYIKAGVEAYKEAQKANEEEKTDTRPTADIEKERTANLEKNLQEQEKKYEKEKAAKNAAYLTKEDIEANKLAEAAAEFKHNKENYEQQARNASGPTPGLEKKDSTYKPWALNSTDDKLASGIPEIIKRNFEKGLAEVTNTGAVTEAGKQIANNTKKDINQGVQEEANKTDATYSGVKKVDAGSILSTILSKYLPDSSDLTFDNTDVNTWGTRNIDASRKNLWNKLIESWNSVFEEEESIPEGDTSFVNKVESSAQKLGEALKKGWDALHKNIPSEPTTSQPTTQSVPTINQGTSTVASVAQEVVQKVTTQESGLDETQQKLDTIDSTASKGAEMKVSTADTAVQNTLKAVKGLQSTASKGVSVKATTSGKGTEQIKNAAAKGADMPIRALDKATPKIKSIETQARKPVSKTLNISPHFTGSWQHSVYLSATGPGAKAATGVNNKISYHHVPMAGSLARGTKKGRVGPRNQGGLTLTGEEGYEVAWIPSENRSAILGASGPEMVNLPKEAVVYNHEQSKEIMKKRQGISAGSMDSGSYPSSSTPAPKTPKKKTQKTSNKTTKTSKPAKTQKAPSLTAETAALSNVIVWWENIARRAEAVQRKADKNQKAYEKYLKNMQATLKDTGVKGKGNEFIANTTKAIAIYTQELNRAKKELQNMDIGTAEQRKAKTASKRATAAKNAFYAEQGGAVQISYSTGSGKKKKTVNKIVGTAGYIKAQDGTYIIDQTKLNTIKNKEERKALADALNKEINDRISKRNKAEDDIKKAQEALEKFGEELYNTFFAWENELTEIWNLTQKIEELQTRASRSDAFGELLEAQLDTGFRVADDKTINNDLNNFKQKLQTQNEVISARQTALKQSQIDLSRELKSQNTRDALAEIQKRLKSKDLNDTERVGYERAQKELNQKIAAEDKAREYTKITRRADGTIGISFDTQSFEKDKLAGNISADMAKAIQDWVKKVEELNKSFDEQYQSLFSEVTEYYKNLDDLQKEWADYEKELIDITENYEKERVDKLKELSDAIKKALDDLLDKVKKRLDERRRVEDNAKTEQDIAKKQQRLAALRADTSGGHQVEIAQLQQEIADAQQDYQRSLEDQLIEKLQEQGDEAAKQRERQIELQEAIADTTNNIEQVSEWMASPEYYKEEIRAQFYANKGYDEVGPAGQAEIANEFEKFYEGLSTNQTKQSELKNSIESLTGALSLLQQAIEEQNMTLANAKDNGIDIREAERRFSGATLKDLNEVGKYTLDEAKKANYSATDIIKAYGTAEALKAGYSGTTIQNANNATIESIQKAINANKDNKNVSQTDLAGVKTKIDINGKNAGGIIEGTVTTGGKYIYANSGSTLYGQAIDTNTGKPTGTVSKTSIGSLTTTHFKGNKKEATEALVYAITHQAWGSKINKNFKALVSAAGIGGKQYKLGAKGHAWYASVGTDGLIYQNVTNGVEKWNPATGKTSLTKYNKANFLAVAKRNNGPSREYAQVLINKKAYTQAQLKKLGVTQFATGGLANYTGPAWLDGTPSKPELVLNATDTKNFMTLKDVLSRAMSSSSQVNNSYGDNATYEININVDHLNNDYDVDKVVERVKKKIVSDSSYRNVTQVRKFR